MACVMANMKSFNRTLFAFPHETHPRAGKVFPKGKWQVKGRELGWWDEAYNRPVPPPELLEVVPERFCTTLPLPIPFPCFCDCLQINCQKEGGF